MCSKSRSPRRRLCSSRAPQPLPLVRILWICRSVRAKAAIKGKARTKATRRGSPKKCFCCGKSGHNKSECRNFSAALKKKAVQPDRAGRYSGVEVDPETGQEEIFLRKGVSHSYPCSLDWMSASSSKMTAILMLTLQTRITSIQKTWWLCFARCFSTQEAGAHRHSDRTFSLSRRKRSHCIRRTAQAWLISASSFTAWVLALRRIEGRFDVRNVSQLGR